MQKDIRDSVLYTEAEAVYRAVRQPGSGQLSDATDLCAHGNQVVFAGAQVDTLEGTPPTRIASLDLTSGALRILTFGPHIDRTPKFSPDGRQVAFLSDRNKSGHFALYLLDPTSGAVRATPPVDGWVEYLQWSPDGKRILLGVAGLGADVAGVQGAVTSEHTGDRTPSWMPTLETGEEAFRWRSLWIYDCNTQHARPVRYEKCNVWDAVWCGTDTLAVVVSPDPVEGSWYSARLDLLDLESGSRRDLHVPRNQLGVLASSPARKLAFVEGLASDRGVVSGDVYLIDSGQPRQIDTHGVDVTYLEWRTAESLLLAGHRRGQSVVSLYNVRTDTLEEVWASSEVCGGWPYLTIAGLNPQGDFALVGEGFLRAPEIAIVRAGQYHVVKSFDLGYKEIATSIGAVEQVSWKAQDGLDIEGWLLLPWNRHVAGAQRPHPLVMILHGGPLWHWRPLWLGRNNALMLMLAARGYAIFLPNPRGSTGRGQAFARQVQGDMGGADARDCLAGIDHLVRRGLADPRRLAVTGTSYGGFLTAWLITQDSRFAAAVPVAPMTNYITERLISNIPHFVKLFLVEDYHQQEYLQRSPVMHARQVTTPTLNICGALDRCTPPEEALQFHSALREAGTKSILVTYPEEGHGIRKWPAAMDYAARVVSWIEEHLTHV